MAENSKIQWTTHTFNPWRGCTKVSPGCANCYAEKLSNRNHKVLGIWGPQGTRVVASESQWKEPLKWDAAAAKAGERHRVFCASLADVFENWQGAMVDSHGRRLMLNDSVTDCHYEPFSESRQFYKWASIRTIRARLFRLIAKTPNLDWLLLTKLPENVLRFTYDSWCKKVEGYVSQNEGDGRRWQFPSNVWIGTSVENQEMADERITELLKIPARVRFLSCEPLLGPVDLKRWLWGFNSNVSSDIGAIVETPRELIHWVIVGGESGPGARRCNVAWVRSIVQQCKSAGVPVFVKQLGSKVFMSWRDFMATCQCPPAVDCHPDTIDRVRLKDSKGGDPEEWPEDLRVREFPRWLTSTGT